MGLIEIASGDSVWRGMRWCNGSTLVSEAGNVGSIPSLLEVIIY